MQSPTVRNGGAESKAPKTGFGTSSGNFKFLTAIGGIEELEFQPNGLRVLLYYKPVAPVVTFNLTYLVGSRNEVTGTTGGTHFLEHLMFKGSTNYNKQKSTSIWNVLQTTGARVNATTYLDRTNYYCSLPSDYLELAISVEADRMRGALFSKADLDSEMEVVRNELERGENSPKELLEKLLWAQAFVAHPYHTSTIGHVWDIENVQVEKLRAFYDQYYHPNNAVAVVVGNFDRTQVLAHLETHFGKIPRFLSPAIANQAVTAEPVQEGNRRFELHRVNTQSLIGVAFHAPSSLRQSQDCHTLQVVDAILSNGPSSRLYRSLVRPGLCSSFSVNSHGFRDGGLFEIYATLTKGIEHATVEAVIMKELEKLAVNGVTEQELVREKKTLLKNFYFSKDGDSSIASNLNESIAGGAWQDYPNYPTLIGAVTSAECKRVAEKYLRTKRGATIGWFFGESSPSLPGSVASPLSLISCQLDFTSPLRASTGTMVSFTKNPVRLLESQRHWTGEQLLKICSSLPLTAGREKGGNKQRILHAQPEPQLMTAEDEEESWITSSESEEDDVFSSSLTSSSALIGMPITSHQQPNKSCEGKKIGSQIQDVTLAEGGIRLLTNVTSVENIVYVFASLRAGTYHALHALRYKNPFVAVFAAKLLTKGTSDRTQEEISDALALRGGTIGVSVDDEHVQLSCCSLTDEAENLPFLIKTLAEQLQKPAYKEEEFLLLKKIYLNRLEAAKSDIYAISSIVASQGMYPSTHPHYEHTLEQQIAWIQSLKLADIREFHASHYGVGSMIFSVVGHFSPVDVQGIIVKNFSTWKAKSPLAPIQTPSKALRFSENKSSATTTTMGSLMSSPSLAAVSSPSLAAVSSPSLMTGTLTAAVAVAATGTEKSAAWKQEYFVSAERPMVGGKTMTYQTPSKALLHKQTKAIHLEGQPNAVLLVTQALGIDYNDPDFYALKVGTFSLGGNFAARLMQTVRDRQGLTYGIGSSLSGFSAPSMDGFFQTKATFAPKNLVRGEAATLDEISAWMSTADLTDEEILSKRDTMICSYKVSLSTAESIAETMLANAQQNKPKEWIDDYVDAVRAVTPEQVRRAILKHLSLSDFLIVKVGSIKN